MVIKMVADWRLTLSPQVMYDNISHVWIKILLNIKFMDCCMIQTKSWAKTVFKTTACSPTNFEVEFSAPGRPWKAGRSVRLKYPYCAKNMLPFSKCFEKIVFPKKFYWDMIFFVISSKMEFLFPQSMTFLL